MKIVKESKNRITISDENGDTFFHVYKSGKVHLELPCSLRDITLTKKEVDAIVAARFDLTYL